MSDDVVIDDAEHPHDGGGAFVFPDLDWRTKDVVIGLLPILMARCAGLLFDSERLRSVGLAVTILGTGWMWLYPALIARFRGAQFRLPSLRSCVFNSVVAVPMLIVIWIGLAIVLGATLVLFPSLDRNTNPFVEPAVGNMNNPYLWGFMLIACTAAPLGEELFFRGMLYGWLRQQIDVRSAILLQGIFFGFIHTYGPLHAVLASFLGISFAIVYEARKTIVTPISLHVLQNTMAMIGTLAMATTIANGPFLGVYGEGRGRGCVLTQVEADGSAGRAELRVGDIIVVVDDQQITDFPSLKVAIREHRVGDKINVQFLRDDKLQHVEVVLQARNQPVDKP